jgi:hypothetical protein
MKKEESQNIALALWNNLHSSAEENIVSSLLTAALNESDTLRAWLIKQVAANHRRNYSNIHTVANCPFPKCLSQKSNIHTDLMLWNCDRDIEWDRFEKNQSRNKAKGLAKNLWGIYVEVKHKWLDRGDAEQYEACAKVLKAVSNKRFFFAIISSHSQKAKERILEQKPKSGSASNWYKVFRNKDISHITFRDIHGQLEQITNDSSKNYLVLTIFREYLNLYLKPENIGQWKADFDYYKQAKLKGKELQAELKSSIYWAIVNVGVGEGLTLKRRRYDTKKAHSVIFVPRTHSIRIEPSNSNTMELEAKIDGEKSPISFTELIANVSYKDKDNFFKLAEQISKRLTKLRKKLTSYATR